MDAVLKAFAVGFLLRSAFAGTFFVLAYWNATNGTCNAIEINSGNVFSVGLVSALVAGVTVYGIHRSVIFPWIEWLFNSNQARGMRRTWLPLISKNTIDDIVRRWQSGAKKGKEQRYYAERITVWADYIHFQQASAWCILIGSAAGVIISRRYPPPHWLLVLALAVFFFAAATGSDWRVRSVEERCRAIEGEHAPH